nr:MAG TPA: hypothetical protein [Caudoviricetes sp.]
MPFEKIHIPADSVNNAVKHFRLALNLIFFPYSC